MSTAAVELPRAVPTVPTWAWLALGIGTAVLVGHRLNVAALAWVSCVPWLVYLRRTQGWRARLLLLAALQVAVALQTAKIITEPIPWLFVPVFSVPSALGAWAAYCGFEVLRRRIGDARGLVLFPSMVVVLEWLAWTGSDLGSWGALAYTQLDNLPLLQTTALFGLAGIAALMAAASAVVAVAIDDPRPRWLRTGAVVAALVIAAHGYGALRLARPLPGPLVTVAAVVADLGLEGGALPSPERLAAEIETLFARSEVAADRGAELIVWNEGAVAVAPDAEEALVARGQRFATERGVDLVLAYVVPLDGMSRFENKYVWLGPSGPVETYLKHHPVPGEGSVRGTAPVVVHERPWGRGAGAICYDYDFPGLGRQHAQGEAGLVFVPSSDWRGIDPIHTQMARVRGIEGGFAVLRPVRWATSGVYDALGRARGTSSWFEGGRVLVARVPVGRVQTLYARVGDVLPLLGLGFVVLSVLGALRRRRR